MNENRAKRAQIDSKCGERGGKILISKLVAILPRDLGIVSFTSHLELCTGKGDFSAPYVNPSAEIMTKDICKITQSV
jgi:hypothetical protein